MGEAKKDVAEKTVEVGWKIQPNGIMTVTVSLQNVATAVYMLTRALRRVHDIVDEGERKQALIK